MGISTEYPSMVATRTSERSSSSRAMYSIAAVRLRPGAMMLSSRFLNVTRKFCNNTRSCIESKLLYKTTNSYSRNLKLLQIHK